MIIVGADSAGKETTGIINDTLNEEIIFCEETVMALYGRKLPIISKNKDLNV